jgi:uncharacterized protein (TIGR02147 family)
MKKQSDLFEYQDYRLFMRDHLATRPNGGRGQLTRIAEHLNTSSVLVSYVFNGSRDFSPEQALEVAEFLGLSDIESDYFCLLVQLARAGTHKLQMKIKAQLKKLRGEAQNFKARVAQDLELTDEAKARFYSSWAYSGVRLASSVESLQSVDAIANRLQLSRAHVREVLEFLIQYGLCIQDGNGGYRMGPKRTHLETSSPLITRHHTNWRLKAIENMEDAIPEEFFYSGPMAVSKDVMAELRKDIADLVLNMVKKVGESPSEELACLNIDFFKLKRRQA